MNLHYLTFIFRLTDDMLHICEEEIASCLIQWKRGNRKINELGLYNGKPSKVEMHIVSDLLFHQGVNDRLS
jgi:hypothetical protein